VSDSFDFKALIIDTPGISSLVPSSPDAEVTLNILKEKIEIAHDLKCVVVVIDATQLARHLYLVKRVTELGHRVCVAVTMADMLERKGASLNFEKLERELGLPVGPIDARTGLGVEKLVEKVKRASHSETPLTKNFQLKPMTTDDIVSIYKWAEGVAQSVLTPGAEQQFDRPDPLTVKVDRFLLHPVWGLVFFVLSMALIFSAIFWFAQPAMDFISGSFERLQGLIEAQFAESWVRNLLTQGLIGGISGVLVFLPQIIILFFAMGYLEDTGYLARGAMLMDRPLSALGLNGRSFMPMLSGFACAIPAMLAARTINSRRERLLTIFVIPLMTCSARLPVYSLLLAFLTPASKPWIGGLAMTGLYLLGIVFVAIRIVSP
jgi:ferrous iron transport protein B